MTIEPYFLLAYSETFLIHAVLHFLLIYIMYARGNGFETGFGGIEKKVWCVMCGYSGFKGKCVKMLVKIVCKRFGVYVVKHYFCTRIQERTAQQHDEGI